MQENEDMSEKTPGGDEMSDLTLVVRLREEDSGGGCSNGTGAVVSTMYDSSYDLKHVVAFESSVLPGRCVEIGINKYHVTAFGTATHTFCYYSAANDYETL